VIAIKRYYDRPGCTCEPSFVGATIAANVFADDLRSERFGHFGGSVGRTVIDNDPLVHKLGKTTKNLFDTLLLVEAWNDDSDRMTFVHEGAGCRI
jgi:hypothetical protein